MLQIWSDRSWQFCAGSKVILCRLQKICIKREIRISSQSSTEEYCCFKSPASGRHWPGTVRNLLDEPSCARASFPPLLPQNLSHQSWYLWLYFPCPVSVYLEPFHLQGLKPVVVVAAPADPKALSNRVFSKKQCPLTVCGVLIQIRNNMECLLWQSPTAWTGYKAACSPSQFHFGGTSSQSTLLRVVRVWSTDRKKKINRGALTLCNERISLKNTETSQNWCAENLLFCASSRAMLIDSKLCESL